MWYLIIPPIIVVLSLSFVLWYLSRKGADPLVAEKASRLGEEAQGQISFLRTKNFFLRILEKTAYRFKVVSLRIHNMLNDLTQTLKVRRRRFQEGVLAKRSLEQVKVSRQEKIVARGSFLQRSAEYDKSEAPAEEQEKPESILVPSVPLQSPLSSRPMVSETAVRPEAIRERTPTDISREENLIARIALNPKDFVAYEGLGDYYLETGNFKDAKECYRQVLKLSPVQRAVKIKIRRLERIFFEKA